MPYFLLASSFTKWLPMKPVPPVTRAFMRPTFGMANTPYSKNYDVKTEIDILYRGDISGIDSFWIDRNYRD
jgi:hypothetical protein